MSSALRKRFSSLLIPTLVLGVLLHEFLTTPVYTDRELAAMREAAVALARTDAATALEKLRALSEVAPHDRAIWGDYLTELVRADRGGEALALFNGNRARALPDYALADLFAAAVQRRDAETAHALADLEIAQSSDFAPVAAARARVLLAAGLVEMPPSAEAPAAARAEQSAASVDGGAATKQAPVATLSPAPSSAVSRSPQAPQRSLLRANRQRPTVSTTPAPVLGASPARANEAVATQEVPALAERARSAVRAAELAPAAERARLAEDALPVVDEYLATLAVDADARKAKLDRVRALTLAEHFDEAAAQFESLGDAAQLPLYGVLHGADLHTRRREPERTRELLAIAASMQPDAREVLSAQFYNQLDLEQYAEAEQTLARLRESSREPEAQRDTQLLAAMFAAYENRLAEAQTQLEDLQRREPDNADIQLRLAQIYRWRGWPRRALAAYRAVDSAGDPGAAQAGEVAAQNDLHAFGAARAQLEQLAAVAPAHPDVKRARREQAERERWEYSAQALAGDSTDSPVTGGGDIAFEHKLYTPPLDDQFRAFAHQRYDWADFPEGAGDANRVGVGVDYRSPQVDVSAELTHRSPAGKAGLVAAGEWKFDDRLSVFGELQIDSDRVPLRALRAGIDGDAAAIGLQYRADEAHAFRAVYSRADFSDDNRRQAFSAQYQQQLFVSAHHALSAIVQGYYSDNTAGNAVPYFNPDSETSLGVVVAYSGTLWRRYERSWSHYARGGIGNYRQEDFGSGGIWDLEYGQRWQWQNLSFNYGLLYRSRIYDGSREGYRAVLGGVNWRF